MQWYSLQLHVVSHDVLSTLTALYFTTCCSVGSPTRSEFNGLVVALSVSGVVVAVTLLGVLVAAVIVAKRKRMTGAGQGEALLEPL